MEIGIVPSIPIEYFSQRREFYNAQKNCNESIMQWYNRLLSLAQQSEFGSASDAFLLEKFVFGLDDEYVSRLAEELEAITLDRSMQITRYVEDIKYQNQFQAIYVNDLKSTETALIKLENEDAAIEEILVKTESRSSAASEDSNSDDDDDPSSDFCETNNIEEYADVSPATDKRAIRKPKALTQPQTKSKRGRKKKQDNDANETAEKKMHYKRRNMIAVAGPNMEISDDYKVFTCKICNKSGNSRSKMSIHISRHLNLKEYICQYCGRGFNTEGSLRVHLKTHTDERAHKCDVCFKAFRSSTMLKHHQNMHNNVKPYPCTVCNKSFRQRSHRIYHMRTHTGERPYECKICGNAFTQSCALKTHMKQHGNAKS